MLDSTFQILKCVDCGSKLDLDILYFEKEIEEGILTCVKCGLKYPIIEKIPVMWNNFTQYLSMRKSLGGYLYKNTKHKKLKEFVKSSLSETTFTKEDRYIVEERWSKIYENSKTSKFYSEVKRFLGDIPKSKRVLEHGCSIGLLTSHLAEIHENVLGIDRSYSALKIAKKSSKNNLDFVLADSLSGVFGQLKFDLVVGLNVLELIEPHQFLDHVSKQISSGYLFISDPYDFERGSNSVKVPIDEKTLRYLIKNLGLKISAKTLRPSYSSWSLKINPRATLTYKVDLVIAKK